MVILLGILLDYKRRCCYLKVGGIQIRIFHSATRMMDNDQEINNSEKTEPPEIVGERLASPPPPTSSKSAELPPRSHSTPSLKQNISQPSYQQQQQDQQQQKLQSSHPVLLGESSKSLFDEESVEVYDNGRYLRSTEQIGKGRFKVVFRGFDAKQGQDIAWSKINLKAQNLSMEEADDLLREMEKGLTLDHPHIIKCHRCWLAGEAGEINLITERFTSGSLRHYRKMFEQVEMNVIRKYARQLLKGLNYLHSKEPPIVHGDLRCDKIYVNGYSGELKIGDLGLATLLPKRFADGQYPRDVSHAVDIKASGISLSTQRQGESLLDSTFS
eukprot:TRINITY_DN33188_c0_g1_i6.p1 TRINITY_DN33188_c0_g1~~TRINITY_DN33188_c0_g1_i6.p1  ORF type:complete len:328 (-),score=35.40 TRINITY_DN33188_c0_g1_i6:43-1026(-)